MSGVPDRRGLPSLTMFGGKMRFATWNARALLHSSDTFRRSQKFQVVRNYLGKADLLVIQETHGAEEDVHTEFAEFLGEFTYHFSPGGRAHGGVLTFMRRAIGTSESPGGNSGISQKDLATSFEPQAIVDGRVLLSTVRFGVDKELAIVNTHNAGLDLSQMSLLTRRLDSLKE